MLDLVEVHEEIYLFLIEKRKKNPELRFTFRKSNYANRLEEGYWFYGNEDYLAISFWNGMDWKNRIPNIAYIIRKDGNSFLEINVSDSDSKREFVQSNIVHELFLENVGKKYVKQYLNFESNYLGAFERFLHNDKGRIDEIINKYEPDFFVESDNLVRNIFPDEFLKTHNKVRKYRKIKEEVEQEEEFYLSEDKPSKLLSIEIKDYGKINELNIAINSKRNQWVFITGENGSGKTNILRAIATALGHRLLAKNEIIDNPNFKINANLLYKNEDYSFTRENNTEAWGKRKSLVQGLAMYGPYRLDTSLERITKVNFYKELNKEESFKSLFKTGVHLLSIDKQFEFWKRGREKERGLFEKRKYYFKSVLTDIVPNLIEINFKDDHKNSLPTEYIFRDSESDNKFVNNWKDLSSGTKSTIALIGDIMIRFYDQQRHIFDPSEFRGIVLIDEVDLHLHPQGQKNLIENLSKTFPNIQFIVSTHSPIPLLGANINSVFFRVLKKSNKVLIDRLDFIEKYIGELLPNQLLTSELFGLDSLTSVRNKDKINIYTGATISDVRESMILKEKGILKDPENLNFLEKLKARLNEESE